MRLRLWMEQSDRHFTNECELNNNNERQRQWKQQKQDQQLQPNIVTVCKYLCSMCVRY